MDFNEVCERKYFKKVGLDEENSESDSDIKRLGEEDLFNIEHNS